jgi:ribosomal protein S18 acetylase RimI-like enzyme
MTEEAEPGDRQAIRERLVAFNVQASPQFRATFEEGRQSLDIFIRDEEGGLRGGLVADCYWGWLDVDLLWVEEDLRGQGHASRLMRIAEEEALARGCSQVCVSTFSFQAPDFYRKQGYRVVGVQEGYPPGSCFYWMRKDLVPQSAAEEEV